MRTENQTGARQTLEQRVDAYTRLLPKAGIIDTQMAAAMQALPIIFHASPPQAPPPPFSENKAVNSKRATIMAQLGLPDL